ncbi:efflux RND transporter periplasmic adaptor subunit [Dasania sp. GY-MA-18]|uniref:Efflux RND transporter periplasmic adaptor subunit n=1 Tax=Dasania phycosphaerae TaxID=2950436 RepID=A0A9J6RGR0_9GAMM|nr:MULTISPECIES: efflux RND transporter periplasmic adaptor subunit [Dasania]MCR8921410.1 efflux RND transporter periplasmic adaptor subunit [Dasania sp. GY-MA-18]MCZ0863838.1 efflux RND transporter periplasmic adaptor subunit [Dasania phycosphaerae]MCZ0867566.1 efflux RND transporter periplasmic adaptor subunit [Dasania phycosphaerae]
MSSLQQIKENKNYHSAAIILVLLLLWMASGLFKDKAKAASHEQASAKAPYSVRAQQISAQAYTPLLRIAAQTEANRSVNVRAEVSGQITALPISKGSIVNAGDIICQLAIEDRQLQVEQALALVDKSALEYDASLQLENSGFQAKTVIATKKSELETARANLQRRRIDLEKINIRAPFAGVIDSRPVEIGDLMQRGDSCATVLDFDPLIVAGQVAGANIKQIKKGDQVTARLLTGEQVQGQVRFVASQSDKLTRTFRVEAAVNNPQNLLHSGITADILVAAPAVMAHVVSPSLLSLDDAGNIGLRIIDQQSQVQFINVNIIGDDSQGVWVTGLPPQTTVITVGQEYVSPGQQVSAVMETSLGHNKPIAQQKNLNTQQATQL